MIYIFARLWRRAEVVTDNELTELRYGKKPAAFLRGLKAVYLGVIFNCTVLAMVLFAATTIAEPFMHWDQWLPAWMFEPMVGMVQAIGVPLPFVPPAEITDATWVRTT